jgi:hypothetical protein
MQRRFILPRKSFVESLCAFSLAKNVSEAVALLEHFRRQCLHKFLQQLRANALGVSAVQSVDDPSDELALFFAQFRNVYHLTFPFASTANAAPLGVKAAQENIATVSSFSGTGLT